MDISTISQITTTSVSAIENAAQPEKQEKTFQSYLMEEVNNVNQKIHTAESNLTDLAAGKNTNLHEVMLSIEEAKPSLNMLMQVRNKALEGVQEILRMQV